MKALLILGATLCCALFASANAQECGGPACGQPELKSQTYDPGCPSGGPTGECYCLNVKYEPVCCDKWRCVDVPYTVQKKCCRQVPQYYEVQKCRYVPQYYTVQACKYVNEEYCVDEQKCRKQYVCDKEVKYVPKYYWTHTCDNQAAAPAQACCPR